MDLLVLLFLIQYGLKIAALIGAAIAVVFTIWLVPKAYYALLRKT